MTHTTIGNFNSLQVAGYVGISNIFIIMLFIYALAPSSGGHVNPMITYATVLTGLTAFPRGVLYVLAQTSGAALAGGLIRGSFGHNLTQL
jgi:glycerol uptake facilitator-like aquaporin